MGLLIMLFVTLFYLILVSLLLICLFCYQINSVTHKATIQLSPHILLKDVSCVPAFKFNLVSIGKLNVQNSCDTVVGTTTCVIQDLASKKIIGLAKWQKGLFVLDFDLSVSPMVLSTSLSDSIFHIPFDDKENVQNIMAL